MSPTTLVGGIAACILLQGFFSGSEMALVSADRLALQADARAGGTRATVALRLLERPAWTLATCLIGTNLSAVTAATLAAQLATQLLGWPAIAAAAMILPFTLTFGEMIPKALFQHHADRVLGLVVLPLQFFAYLLSPLLWVVDRLFRALGGSGEGAVRTVTRQQLKLFLDAAAQQTDGPLSADDRAIIRRVFAFGEAVVEDAMVPLISVVALPCGTSLTDAARRMTETGHSRLPVYRDRIDQIVGIIIHQDLLGATDWAAPVEAVCRPAFFVPETKRVDELLAEMRSRRQRIAVAVDEYGGAVGIITAEDLLEEIVGDIHDETDRSGAMVRRTGERTWLASGRAEGEHLEAAAGLLLPEGQYETLAGFLLARLGRIPQVGDGLTVEPFRLSVTKASDRAILEVLIERRAS